MIDPHLVMSSFVQSSPEEQRARDRAVQRGFENRNRSASARRSYNLGRIVGGFIPHKYKVR